MSLQKYSIFAILAILALWFSPSGAFAASSENISITNSVKKTVLFAAFSAKPTLKTSVLPDTVSASGSDESPGALAERQKTYDNMNTLLIQSYKTKLDKILTDVYDSVENVAKDDPALQAAILEKIAEEIDKKIENMEKQGISPNRKKILLSIFSYLKTEILAKADDLSQKGK